jgi:hypothetical protein
MEDQLLVVRCHCRLKEKKSDEEAKKKRSIGLRQKVASL